MSRFAISSDYVHSDDLTKIVQYVDAQQRIPRGKTVLLYGVIALDAMIAPVTFLKPSYADTPPYRIPDHPVTRGGQVGSTWIATTALLYLACSEYMQARLEYLIPSELVDFTEGLTPEQIRRQDIGIGVISAASAIPLTTPLMKFPLISTDDSRIDIPLNTVLILVVLGSNTIAHLRPLQVIINNPWYGAPFTAVKYIKNKIQQRNFTAEQKKEQKFLAIENNNKKQLRKHFLQTLNRNAEHIIQECITFHLLPFPGYRFNRTEYLKQIDSLTDDAFIFSLIHAQSLPVSQNQKSGCRQTLYSIFRHLLGHIAGALATGESVGYFLDSVIQIAKLVNSLLGGSLLAAIPIYSFGVLIHNAARVQTLDVVDFFSDSMRGKANLSWPLKYGARVFFGVMSIPGMIILLLNSSSANTMIRIDLGEYCSNTFIDYYIATFRWGYAWLATLLVINTEKHIFTNFAKYFGNQDVKAIAHFSERVHEIVNTRILQWKPEQLIDWLNKQTPGFREKALGISDENYQELIIKPEESKDVSEQRSSVKRFLDCCGQCIWLFLTCHCIGKVSSESDNRMDDYRILEESRGESVSESQIIESSSPSPSWCDAICFWRTQTSGSKPLITPVASINIQ